MKGLFKKSLAFFMVFAMIFTCAPYSLARDEASVQSQSSTGFSGGTGLNPIVQSFSEEDKNSYSIVSVEINDKSATVELNNKAACTLVVAVYEEGSTHMLGCAVADIEASAGTVTATIDVDTLPEYYIAKAYLLNSGYTSLSGEEYLLCEPYTYIGKTKAYEQFLAKEPEDFSGEEIIVFDDEKERTDFAVFTDDVILSDDSGEIEFTYNEETSTYTFTKAPDDLSALKPGDIYYYEYGEAANEFLLFKVKTVTVSGSEVTVQADTDFGIGEAFSFVRVDAKADFSGIDDSDMTFGSGYTQVEENGEIALMGSLGSDEKFVYSTAANIEYKINEAVSLSAEIGLVYSGSTRLYYDSKLFGDDFYEFKFISSVTLNIFSFSVTGKIELPSEDYEIISPTIPVGPFGLTFSIAPVLEFSGSVSGSFSYSSSFVTTADNMNGFNRLVDSANNFELDANAEFTAEIGFQLNAALGLIKVIDLKLTPQAVVQISGEPDTVGINEEKHHRCIVCIVGEADLVISGTLSLNIKIIPEKLDFSWPFVELKYYFNLFDFYISTTGQGVKFGKGNCPNIGYKAIINVLDEDGKEISGATVTCLTGFCDSNGDGIFAETSMKTDSSGKAVFYLKAGSHSLDVSHPNYITESTSVNMLAVSKNINITMEKRDYRKLTVIVKDIDYSSPRKGAVVTVSGRGENSGLSYTQETNNTGSAEFELPAGIYDITVSCNGYNDKILNSVSVENDMELEAVLVPEGVVLLGSYPQSEVTDTQLLSELNSLSLDWVSYGYYSNSESNWATMKPGAWMLYADVLYGGEKYRAVKFTHYRPERTFWPALNNSAANGYYNNTVYWFKYEPIQWIVTDSDDGFLFSRYLIDAQPFNNVLDSDLTYLDKNEDNNDEAKRYCYFNGTGNYASDYAASSVRTWLNNDFYNTAFTAEEKEQIGITTLDNSCHYPEYPMLNSATTNDKIFLPSDKEFESIMNYTYENSNDSLYYDVESPSITNYAKCQGRCVNVDWWLRTPGYRSDNACSVTYTGYIAGKDTTDYIKGIRPALKLNPDSDMLKSYVSNSADEPEIQLNSDSHVDTISTEQSGEISFVKDNCVPNQKYVILNVTGYGSDFKLSTDNLYYIDTVIADEKGTVTVEFTQKQPAGNSTTLLIGDFGNGTETVILKTEAAINAPSVTKINYGDTLVLSATVASLPSGAKIEWIVDGSGFSKAVSEDGLECRLTSNASGTATVTVRIVDENGEAVAGADGNEIGDSIELKSNAGFFRRLISFFKNLFRMNRIIY